jgi:hypothetical protein
MVKCEHVRVELFDDPARLGTFAFGVALGGNDDVDVNGEGDDFLALLVGADVRVGDFDLGEG